MGFATRSEQAEWLDDPAVAPSVVAASLVDLAAVNTVTLARLPTLGFLARIVRRLPPGRPLSVLDVGYGGGDMLRRIARWGVRRGVALQLAGIDLSPVAATVARRATPAALAIDYRTGDVFDEKPGSADVVISSLFTHHLRDAELVRFLRWMERTATRGWFVNDLHRHPLAYHGFAALSWAAGWDKVVQHDGRISVARAFRRDDWARVLQEAELDRVAAISWHVPFRLCVTRLR